MNELIPCPFCGSAVEIHECANGSAFPLCGNLDCGASLRLCDSKEEAIKLWNTRTTKTTTDKE